MDLEGHTYDMKFSTLARTPEAGPKDLLNVSLKPGHDEGVL